jgi:flagellar biosynthetic protein FliP
MNTTSRHAILSRARIALALVLLLTAALAATAPAASAQTLSQNGGAITLQVDGGQDQLSTSIKIVLLMTVLTLAPSIVILTTSFTRILIVLGFLRQAIGTHQMPSNQILAGIALFLTVVVMMPVFQEINETAVQPYLKAQEQAVDGAQPAMTEREALERGVIPLKRFMLAQTRQKDLAMFLDFSHKEMPTVPEEISLSIVVPSFLTSELKTAFQMGFMLYLPFLVVDMVIASVLMSMGMMMLPPVLISLPFKILLFVLVDGWHLVTRSLVTAFAVTS